jgi:hypothetical protein
MHPLPLEESAIQRSNGHVPSLSGETARLSAEVKRLEALCRRQGAALEGLTKILRRLRRGDSALKEQNAELEGELQRLRERSSARHRPGR